MNDWLFLLETVRASWTRMGRPERVAAAVSGGADSVALLHVLRALAREEGFFLAAAHVNHGLRETAGLDEAFVERMCEEMGIPCRVCRVRLAEKSEDAARAARYDALKMACWTFDAPVLALAHHRRDQAETVLLHLFRGSGGGGLAAMGERALREYPDGESLTLWRPLLNTPPEAIRRALEQQGIPWREDETNAQDGYLRNYIRHQVLPVVGRRIPKAEQAIGRAARILSEEDAYFRQEAASFLKQGENARLQGPCRWLRGGPLSSLHPALRRYALRMACPVSLDWETTEGLMGLAPGQTMNLPRSWRAKRTGQYLHFLPPVQEPFSSALKKEDILCFPWQGETGDGIRAQAVPRAVYERCELRLGRAGDEIHPLGGPGVKSMQDYWVDKKTDQPFRRYMPLLCLGSRVVWAIGAGAGEEARVRPGDDAVLLRYEGYLPFYEG